MWKQQLQCEYSLLQNVSKLNMWSFICQNGALLSHLINILVFKKALYFLS